jgi:TPR repeat protein
MRFVCISLSVVVLFALSSRFLQASEVVRPTEQAGTDVAFLLNLARSGKVEAQVLLGEYFLDRQEYAEALPWLRLAAGQGEVEAQRRLALMYETGQGVPRDYEQAAFWLRCATEQRDSVAFYKEGFSYTTSAGVP